jgi:CheY-like chemotaxis protein
MINNFVDVIDKFLNTFQEKILKTEFILVDELEKVGLKNAQEDFVQDWHSRFFSINNIGFNVIKSSRDNTNKMIEHLELYKQNIKNERRINEILKELKMGEIIGEEVKKIELSYIRPNSIIARDLYSETGVKLKSAYETITEEDLTKFKLKNIKNLYFDNPVTKELNPSDYRIVAIDDSIIVTTMIQKWLEEFGFKVKIYNESLKALVNILRDDFPDLILLDIMMPNMDGFLFLENLKTFQKGQIRLPIIIITAISGESHIRRAITLGAIDYHIKPLNKDLLLKKIFHTLSLSESSKK